MAKLNRVLALLIGVGALLGAGLTSASAAPPWTVVAGLTSSGSTTFTGYSFGLAPNVTFSYPSGTQTTCASGTLAGQVPHLGSGLPATGLLVATSAGFTSCNGPFGAMAVTLAGTPSFNASSYDPTSTVTTGTLSGVSLHFAAGPGAPTCTFDLTGTTDAGYSNSTHALTIATVAGSGHFLVVSAVAGCFGAVANGYVVNWQEVLSISTPLEYLRITSP